jgi:hypothetical protein
MTTDHPPGRTLPCVQCGVNATDAMFSMCCGLPMCKSCLDAHGYCDQEDPEVAPAS